MAEQEEEYLDLVDHIRDLDMVDSEDAMISVEGGDTFSQPNPSEPMTEGDQNEYTDITYLRCESMIDSGEGGSARMGNENENGQNKKKRKKKSKKKSKKKNKKKWSDRPDDLDVTNINEFVVRASWLLKEHKPYLIWNAIDYLGIHAVKNLIKEVFAIEACGGQQTNDKKRLRTGGGILLNILKSREPKAYKHIVTEGKKFEKQFRHERFRRPVKWNATMMNKGGPEDKSKAVAPPELSSEKHHRVSALDRIRIPVSYNDLFEEGEIAFDDQSNVLDSM